LTRFHGEVLYPEMKRLVEETVKASERRLRDQIRALAAITLRVEARLEE
jgi:hypothetical protein